MTTSVSNSLIQSFVFWKPQRRMELSIGADEQYLLPDIPLPLDAADAPQNPSEIPSERSIGEGIYDYLRARPDTEYAAQYAEILRYSYPFLISDIGSQLLLLDLRPNDLTALQNKGALLRILLHLDSDNFGLQHKLGVNHHDLAIHPQATEEITAHLQSARQWLEQARRSRPDDVNNLNYLAQVCYLTGNYHQAKLYWQNALNLINSPESQAPLQRRLELLSQGVVPIDPLRNQLNQMAQARNLLNAGNVEQAYHLVETLVRQGELLPDLPSAELYYFIGTCRLEMNDVAGAYEALTMATDLDDKHEQAQAALSRIAPDSQERT